MQGTPRGKVGLQGMQGTRQVNLLGKQVTMDTNQPSRRWKDLQCSLQAEAATPGES